jgi:hypothetical protein
MSEEKFQPENEYQEGLVFAEEDEELMDKLVDRRLHD